MKLKPRGIMYSLKKALAVFLAVSMVVGYVPSGIFAAAKSVSSTVDTVADPETLTRPGTIYGDSTVNSGKVTVGKSVSNEDVTGIAEDPITLNEEDNFLVTISQSSQVMGLTSEMKMPLDVVIVFDTSGSMGNDSNNNRKIVLRNS